MLPYYYSVSEYLKKTYGHKLYKLSLSGGMTCPNRDGLIDTRGCIFCSSQGSGDFAVTDIDKAKSIVADKYSGNEYIAYFQSFTNTYADADYLKNLFTPVIMRDDIRILSIATRPDCLPDEVRTLLSDLRQQFPGKFIWIELGLQTIHPESVSYIRRGYENEVYLDAVKRLRAAGIEVVTHIILGLPGETAEDCAATTRYAVEAGTDGIKFQLLHVLKGTDLAQDYLAGKFRCLSLEEYGQYLKACLARVPEGVTVYRITGDGAKRDLLAPMWSADKKRVLNYLNRTLFRE